MNKYKKFIKKLGNECMEVSPTLIKGLFPELFETKLEVGKWYWMDKETRKRKHFLFNYQLGDDVYGFFADEWEEESWTWGTAIGSEIPATDKEVQEMLIKEAKKRGYKEGNFECLVGLQRRKDEDVSEWHFKKGVNRLFTAKNMDGGRVVFEGGKWATIIEEPLELTVEEISEKYGREVRKRS